MVARVKQEAAENPFGDGEAARKILKILSEKCSGGSATLSIVLVIEY